MAKVTPVPDGYHTLTPSLIISGAADAIDFYKDVFGATERMRFDGPDGTIAHAEIQIGDSVVMVSDEYKDMGYASPQSVGGTPVLLHLYVADVDATVARAAARGAKIHDPVSDKFYGDRSGVIIDPWGHIWSIGTHIEDVPPDEMARRAAELGQQ
ncbi:MAG: VOC family protein [Actinomycetota bacterium]